MKYIVEKNAENLIPKVIFLKNVLFLDGNSTGEFYNRYRAKYATVSSIFKSNSIISKVFRRVFKIFKIPLFPILYGEWIKTIKFKKYDYIIINDNPYNALIAKDIRKRTESKIILWYWNPILSDINKINLNSCEYWSFDHKDCIKNNMRFADTYYFSDIKLPCDIIERDIYFIGADKGRLTKLLALKKSLEELSIKTKFHIVETGRKKTEIHYKYDKYISYEQVLIEISKSKAILDILQENQNGYTQRAMEALFFRKKLITNNAAIINADFYNSNNIFVLGINNLNDLKEFLEKPYLMIDNKILESYDFNNWLDNFTG